MENTYEKHNLIWSLYSVDRLKTGILSDIGGFKAKYLFKINQKQSRKTSFLNRLFTVFLENWIKANSN